ncbi:mucolipin-3-like isoform X2 [Synchiropus splendidus]|uniref:mucolipin-3-like isoform X2 n=1 Tax=Synchiropus splendidus TaxID=270530 RepID=UPI00237E26D6|nr:mucolipin-3-like isoform X2 [Synchiropus splendidus]
MVETEPDWDCEMPLMAQIDSDMEEESDFHEVYDQDTGWSDHQQDHEDPNVECLRRKIKYYFMNPCEKYHARGRKPWKLMLQLVKIAIITIQLVSFGLSNQMVVTFKEENLMTFKHLFLKDYTDGSMDTYAVYRQADVYDHIDYIIEQLQVKSSIKQLKRS